MSTESKIRTGLELVRVGLDAAQGRADPAAIAAAAVDVALEFVPVDDLRAYLDAKAIERAELVGDAIKAARFPEGG